MKITILCLICLIGKIFGKFSNGFYGDHPLYRSDDPPLIILKLIPFGLPRGGTSMKGLPYGLLAYATKFGSWKRMLLHYQKSRMMERSYKLNFIGASDSWLT